MCGMVHADDIIVFVMAPHGVMQWSTGRSAYNATTSHPLLTPPVAGQWPWSSSAPVSWVSSSVQVYVHCTL